MLTNYHMISAESMPVAIGRPGFPPLARTLRMIKMPAKDFAPAQPSRRTAFRQSASQPVCSWKSLPPLFGTWNRFQSVPWSGGSADRLYGVPAFPHSRSCLRFRCPAVRLSGCLAVRLCGCIHRLGEGVIIL